MVDTYCSDCKMYTEVVIDYSAGDSVCTECGLVLEARTIDETAEWRTFANESTDNDPVRVGDSFNPLLGDCELGTVISNPKGVFTCDYFLARESNRDRTVISGFKTIGDMCDRLGLVKTIKDRACEMYKKLVEDRKASRRKDKNAILAACLYLACRLEDKPRSVKEICSVANVASIRGAMHYVTKQIEVEKDRTVRAGDFVGRFCWNLGVNKQSVIRAAQEAVEKCGEIDIRRSPTSIAAAVVYIVTQLSDEKKSLEDVLLATQVGKDTIRSSYKDIYPHLVRIVPSWYAQQEDLKNLKC